MNNEQLPAYVITVGPNGSTARKSNLDPKLRRLQRRGWSAASHLAMLIAGALVIIGAPLLSPASPEVVPLQRAERVESLADGYAWYAPSPRLVAATPFSPALMPEIHSARSTPEVSSRPRG